MSHSLRLLPAVAGALCAIAVAFCALAVPVGAAENDDASWTTDFPASAEDWSSSGSNPYFILEPGYRLVLEGGDERLVITVLDETRLVDGVETRVVEERETKKGDLVEVSRNFFAMNRRTNGVYYFGEEVDIYKDGEIASHGGAWLSGAGGAKFGLMMPGEPLLHAKYYEEIAPGAAMDRAEIVSLHAPMETPAGEFPDCLKIEETTPLEPDEREFKYYARGVGLVKDGSVELVSYGPAR